MWICRLRGKSHRSLEGMCMHELEDEDVIVGICRLQYKNQQSLEGMYTHETEDEDVRVGICEHRGYSDPSLRDAEDLAMGCLHQQLGL
jgi:hypothetical protein